MPSEDTKILVSLEGILVVILPCPLPTPPLVGFPLITQKRSKVQP